MIHRPLSTPYTFNHIKSLQTPSNRHDACCCLSSFTSKWHSHQWKRQQHASFCFTSKEACQQAYNSQVCSEYKSPVECSNKLSANQTVKIRVSKGGEAETFYVSKPFLCHHSPFFDAALWFIPLYNHIHDPFTTNQLIYGPFQINQSVFPLHRLGAWTNSSLAMKSSRKESRKLRTSTVKLHKSSVFWLSAYTLRISWPKTRMAVTSSIRMFSLRWQYMWTAFWWWISTMQPSQKS